MSATATGPLCATPSNSRAPGATIRSVHLESPEEKSEMSEIKAFTNMTIARAHQAELHRAAANARMARAGQPVEDQEERQPSPKLSPRRLVTAFVTVILALTVAAGVALAQPSSPSHSNNYDPGCQPSRTHTTAC